MLAARIRLAACAMAIALLGLIALGRPSAVLAGPASPAPRLSSETETPVFSPELEEELEEASGEEGEDEEEPSEEEEEEGEEAAEDEAEGPFPPEECILRSAHSQVFAYPGQDRVRLVIAYTALAPAEVAVDYSLAGRKGSLGLGTARRRLGRQGRLQFTAHLSKGKMKVVLAARAFTVDTDIVAAPGYCRRFYTRHLGIKRGGRSQLVWSQSDSIFGL